jgi:hypothetical protein
LTSKKVAYTLHIKNQVTGLNYKEWGMSNRSVAELSIWFDNIQESDINLEAHSAFTGNDAVCHLNYQ